MPRHLPAARRCQRVAFNIFLCFFLRMRLRRFLISDPMTCGRLAGLRGLAPGWACQGGPTDSELMIHGCSATLKVCYQWCRYWRVVQPAERLALDQEVGGSSPPPPASHSSH